MGDITETARRSCPDDPFRRLCPKRNALLESYVAAACVHARALEELRAILRAGLDEEFATMLTIVGEACGKCGEACRAFEAHRRSHGC